MRPQSLYADIITDFITLGAESTQVTIEGMKPATLRAGLRRAQRNRRREDGAEESGTYLVRKSP